jgi:hypothetical protein
MWDLDHHAYQADDHIQRRVNYGRLRTKSALAFGLRRWRDIHSDVGSIKAAIMSDILQSLLQRCLPVSSVNRERVFVVKSTGPVSTCRMG